MKKIDGLPVANAAIPLRLRVTKADIEKGAPKNPNACAIAVAAIRQVKGATAAKVHMSCVYVMVNKQWKRWRTPEYATREIVAFDRGGEFIPGDYELLPVSVNTLARKVAKIRGTSSSSKRSSGTRKRRKPHHTEGVRDTAHGNDPHE